MPQDVLKVDLASAIFTLVEEDMAKSALRVETVRISDLQQQVKVWPENGAPRYFVVQVKEQL